MKTSDDELPIVSRGAPDEGTLLAMAAQENSTDLTAQLVYADWLDEHGESIRAEFIRAKADLVANGPSDGRQARYNKAAKKLDASFKETLYGDKDEQANRDMVRRALDNSATNAFEEDIFGPHPEFGGEHD